MIYEGEELHHKKHISKEEVLGNHLQKIEGMPDL